jgi:hypothetical protein
MQATQVQWAVNDSLNTYNLELQKNIQALKDFTTRIVSGGGEKPEGLPSVDTTAFNDAVKKFNDGIANIPTTIALNGKHDVNLNINGAEALGTMMPAIKQMINDQILANMPKQLAATDMPESMRGAVGQQTA